MLGILRAESLQKTVKIYITKPIAQIQVARDIHLIAHKQIRIQVQGIKAHELLTQITHRLETQTVVVHINTTLLQIQILNRAVSFRLPAPQAIDINVLPQQPTVQQGRAILILQAGLVQHIGMQIHRAEQLTDLQVQNL